MTLSGRYSPHALWGRGPRGGIDADKVAVRFEGSELTYGELDRRADQVAIWLEAEGVGHGDRVGWLGANQPMVLDLLAACARLGAILVPLNTRLAAAEHRAQLEHSGAVVLVCDVAAKSAAADALPARCRLCVASPLGEAPALDRALPDAAAPAADTPLLLVYTSGTTGAPKGAVHTHRSLQVTWRNGIESQGLTADEITLNFLPMFHVGGLNIQTVPTLLVGGTVVLHRAFEPGRVLDDIERWGVTTAVFVPATMGPTFAHPRWGTADLSSIRGLQTGSSVIPAALLQTLIDRGLAPGQVYGSTETGPTCVVLPSEECERVGSAGRAAPHSEIRVGAGGELQVRGGHLFDHYWRNPEATAAAFDDGWYRTGDVATIDNQGYVWIEGRVDDLIISGGENIDPLEVEAALADAPGVADVAVVAGPDERWGQSPVAFVVVADGHRTPTLDALRAHAEPKLARFKLPTRLELVDVLPRTALGKVQKFLLRKRL